MVKGVLRCGEIIPIEPLPMEWNDGQPLQIENAEEVADSVERIDRDFAELNSLFATNDPADEEIVERALEEADRRAKEFVRRQMGLT